jgi:hypothetical protein
MWAAPVSWSNVYARLQVLSRGVVDQKNRDFIASVLGREAAGDRVFRSNFLFDAIAKNPAATGAGAVPAQLPIMVRTAPRR